MVTQPENSHSNQRKKTGGRQWLVNFAGISLVYFFLNWTPSLLVARGFGSGLAIRAAAIFAISGVAGSLFQLWLMRLLGPVRLLGGAYVVTIGASALLAAVPASGIAFFLSLTVAAASSVGAQFCLNAVVARHYPAAIRATGTAYATGAGRLGAIVAPAAAGLALQTIASPRFALGLAVFPAAIALAALLLLGRSGTIAIEDSSID